MYIVIVLTQCTRVYPNNFGRVRNNYPVCMHIHIRVNVFGRVALCMYYVDKKKPGDLMPYHLKYLVVCNILFAIAH